MTPAPTTTPPRISAVPYRMQFHAYPGTPDHVVGWVTAHLLRRGVESPALAEPLRLLADTFPRGTRFRAVCWPYPSAWVDVELDPLEPLAKNLVVDRAAMGKLLPDDQWKRQRSGGWWMKAPLRRSARGRAPV